jgi:catechol 2,3-dioxygenase-like lactoylglutathione lyase family enzyme
LFEIRGPGVPTGASTEAGPTGLAGLRLAWDDPDRFRPELESNATVTESPTHESATRTSTGTTRAWISTHVNPVISRSISVELIGGAEGPEPAWNDQGTNTGRQRGEIDPRSTLSGLDHVVVFSEDIDATRDFYADRLGIRLALDRSFEKRGVRLLFFRIGGVTLEIGGRLAAEPKPDSIDRFGGLAWQVADIDATQSRLRADRFDVSEIRDGNKPGTRVCTVRDPVHSVPTLLIEPVS